MSLLQKCSELHGQFLSDGLQRSFAASSYHEIVEEIKEAGAGLQSLSEPWADTTSYAGKMVLTIFAGIAEFERDLIRDRTSTGRIAAKRRGVRFGRPVKLNPEQKESATQLFEEGKSAEQIAKTFNVHPATIYRLGSKDV